MSVLVDFYEDLDIGTKFELGARTYDAEMIKAYAEKYDPQPFHVSEEAAAQSHFGKLCASGWQTAGLWMRCYADYNMAERARRTADGVKIADIGISPGMVDLRWPKPVYVGDTISYTMELLDKRPMNSQPGWGMLTALCQGHNQNGELVLSFTSSTIVQMRG